jgi:hypothetical protein
MLGVAKNGDTVGLFQEASDPKQAGVSTSKLIFMNKTSGLTHQQPLPGRVVSKAEFHHFRVAAGWNQGTYQLQSASYFISESDAKKRTLTAFWPGFA